MQASDAVRIRESRPGDARALKRLYTRAFPEEDLLPLLRSLSGHPAVLSLVAATGEAVVGHTAFTRCGVTNRDLTVALLAPLAVDPSSQRRGIGTALLREGLFRLADDGVEFVCVLGDPAFYGRLGFRAESNIQPPYPLPAEWAGAWQSYSPGGADAEATGTLVVPRPWRDPSLWSI